MKVALVHDWLVGQGGGERVLKSLHELYPEAPIYTLVYDRAKAPSWLEGCDVRTTYIQRWPGAKSHHKLLLSFMPKAWESLDLTEFDLVISSCASCCKGVLTRPDAVHICYCHSPIRYVWDLYYDYLESAGTFKRLFMPQLIHTVRTWDYLAAQRVDEFIANSNFVAKRIEKFYRRRATTIYPGSQVEDCDVALATEVKVGTNDYYLVVSRFVKYKRVDIAIEACNKLGKRLVIIGSGGEEEERLKAMAGSTVEFLGRVSDGEMRHWYRNAKAFLFPGIEDFGLTPVEAMAAGSPVLAYRAGGALETVEEGRTGLFFDTQNVESLCECIERFERKGVGLSRQEIHEYSKRFSERRFMTEIQEFINGKLAEKGYL